MIRVTEAAEPVRFKACVTIPGLRALAEMVGEKPKRDAGRRFNTIASKREDIPTEKFPPYWTNVLADLMNAYDQTCAYSCFRIHEVTGWRSVDHFAPKSRKWDQDYHGIWQTMKRSEPCEVKGILEEYDSERMSRALHATAKHIVK